MFGLLYFILPGLLGSREEGEFGYYNLSLTGVIVVPTSVFKREVHMENILCYIHPFFFCFCLQEKYLCKPIED